MTGDADDRAQLVATEVQPVAEPAGALDNLRCGRSFVAHIVAAVCATLERRTRDADRYAEIADRLLWPLGDLTDPEDVRDFIAGAASEAEMRLAILADLINPTVRENP